MVVNNNVKYCYSCADHMTFQMHGYTADFPKRIAELSKQYHEGLVVKCDLCDCTVKYVRDETSGKLREEVTQ